MELKWLDDYVALIEAGSFSAAAARRHVSQPAFSRRIQMLEAWLGVTLVDRARKPLQLTPVAAEHQDAFRSLVARIYEFRAVLKAEALDSAGITIAAQHTLAAAYVPAFLVRLQGLSPGQSYRIRSENRTDSVAMLMRGQAEILITYETMQTRCGIPAPMARREVLGTDELVLVASPALHASLVGVGAGDPVPMLCFPPESFFGQVVRAEAMPELMRRQQVVVRCVSEFAMGLRELALIGQGAAWLPASLIRDDLRRGRLRPLETLGRPVAMDIVVYVAAPDSDAGAALAARIASLSSGGQRRRGRRRHGPRRAPRAVAPSRGLRGAGKCDSSACGR
jgi:DNA-binding transcriptional LysR family regulator